MAMTNAFSAVAQNLLSRRFGSYQKGVADPYVTGYHFIWFEKMDQLKINTTVEPCGAMDASDIQKTLAALCTGVTPPGGTLNKIEFTGLGGVKWSVPGNLDYGNSFSIKFTEMQGLPITSIMHQWIKNIRDYRTGASNISDQENEYSKKNYSTLMYYWTTAPDAQTIEYFAAYDGVFPTKDPADLHASDVESIGKLDIEIEFNCDYVWHESWVKEKCQTFAKQVMNTQSEIIGYGNSAE